MVVEKYSAFSMQGRWVYSISLGIKRRFTSVNGCVIQVNLIACFYNFYVKLFLILSRIIITKFASFGRHSSFSLTPAAVLILIGSTISASIAIRPKLFKTLLS